MRFLILLFSVLIFSCEKEKTIQLPEISQAKKTKVSNTSQAYVYYDETEPDGAELNTKKLIENTNWIVHVDKRLALKYVIPHITAIQNKKSVSNRYKRTKKYFACNDLELKNMAFVDFTKTEYFKESAVTSSADFLKINGTEDIGYFSFKLFNDTTITNIYLKKLNEASYKTELRRLIKRFDTQKNSIFLNFNEDLLFQEYMTFKKTLQSITLKHAKLSYKETIYN